MELLHPPVFEKLHRVSRFLEKVLRNQDLLTVFNEYNFDIHSFSEGKWLYAKYRQLLEKNSDRYREYYSADCSLQKSWQKANLLYLRHLEISRKALENDKKYFQQLDIDGPRHISVSGWLSRANRFYINCMADMDIRSKLQKYGISFSDLETGKKWVDTVMTNYIAISKYDLKSRKFIFEFEKTLDSLWRWSCDFLKVSAAIAHRYPDLINKSEVDDFQYYVCSKN